MRLLMKQVVSGVGFIGIGLSSVAALAQESGDALSLAARETSVPGGVLLMVAYMALWLMVFGYLAMIMRRQSALSRDLTALEQRMDDVFGGDSD